MVTAEATRPAPKATAEAPSSSTRISFSADFLDENLGFLSPVPIKPLDDHHDEVLDLEESCGAPEFEFLSTNTSLDSMLSADELFREGKLLPKFWLAEEHCDDKPGNNAGSTIVSRKGKDGAEKDREGRRSCSMNPEWFVDEDPSPRPPNCTVLWKELLRLRKQRAAVSPPCPSTSVMLSPSSSTSSSSSSMADVAVREVKDGTKSAKRMKKGVGLERTSSGTMRIRPMINVPICTVANASRLHQPLLPPKKGRVEW
ncbi:hypothetical protein MLD38_016902 [Melastoma candidum]|uniref:Uncharacterized protein n=1 Tax=Melastoma candidum TaxID=119954 RepID=A0ACB9QNW7_9MYRT|nr:hypothetical protein MLD38_016902 [Melastoma candidum]